MPAEAKPKTGKVPVVKLQPVAADSAEVPASIPPELVELFKVAIQTMPPGATATLLKENWKLVVAFIFPLLLTTYNAVKGIVEGPAQIAALGEIVKKDHEEIEGLKKEVQGANAKLDRLLWGPQPASSRASY